MNIARKRMCELLDCRLIKNSVLGVSRACVCRVEYPELQLELTRLDTLETEQQIIVRHESKSELAMKIA